MARTPVVKETVGDFSLPGGYLDEDRFVRSDYVLSAQRGAPVVLAFYPGDNTPVCTAQLCSYSDGLESLQSTGATVWGISPQTLDSHERFARARGLRIPLLTDGDREVTRSFGIDAPLIGLRRSVFIIAPDGRLHWKRVGTFGATFPPAATLSRHLLDLDSS
ncbi:peroxiredoxin [Streptomyces sp. NPDC006879]|uniref:peroxiredoxin n=1 Tax=Streptomyces sp. NPDC006879 TaxID=3364767 RepID=UPI003680691A